MTRLALVPHPLLGERMAGPGWRYWKLARALAGRLDVTLLAPPGSRAPEPDGPPLVEVSAFELGRRVAEFDAVLTQGIWISPLRDGAFLRVPRLLLDFYDPLCVELPAHYAAAPEKAGAAGRYDDHVRRLSYLLGHADAFCVANERQRDLLLGLAIGAGRIRLEDFRAPGGPGRRFLSVPCGTDTAPDPPADDGTWRLAWGGGAWRWFDTDLALDLAARLHGEDPRYRLLVPGGDPPGPEARLAEASGMRRRVEAEPELREAVEWLEGWRPRPEFLAELARCRVGLSLTPAGEESRFAHRTRVLDYLTAGLPCVLSEGDALAEQGAAEGWARVVPPGDLEACRRAVRALAEDGPERSAALEALVPARKARAWDRSAEAVADYLEDPPERRATGSWPWNALAHQLRRIT